MLDREMRYLQVSERWCLSSPQSVLINSSNNLYIADFGNNRIRKADASGTISTFAGHGASNCYGDNGQANLRYDW